MNDIRKYAAEHGIAEEEALKKGIEEKSKEFVENPGDGPGSRQTGLSTRPATRRVV